LHFAGYALWNYVSTPLMFLRPGFELEELGSWNEDGELVPPDGSAPSQR
jgi:hypothetical protein